MLPVCPASSLPHRHHRFIQEPFLYEKARYQKAVLRSWGREGGEDQIGDERIRGDSGFVESVLERQNEQLDRHYRLRAQGYDFDRVVDRVAQLFGMRHEEILSRCKQQERVRARGPVCYWSVNGQSSSSSRGIRG